MHDKPSRNNGTETQYCRPTVPHPEIHCETAQQLLTSYFNTIKTAKGFISDFSSQLGR